MQKTKDRHYQVEPATKESFPRDARAVGVTFNETHIVVDLEDGRIVSVPLRWFPAIERATPDQRAQVKINLDGRLLSWDPDDTDGAINQLEWLTGTSPVASSNFWPGATVERTGTSVVVTYPRVANRGFEVQSATNLSASPSWEALNVAENHPYFAASNSVVNVPDSISNAPSKYYRVRVYEP